MVLAGAGAGLLVGDLSRFTPGIQQGSAVLAGLGSLLAPSSQQLLGSSAIGLTGSVVLGASLAQQNALAGFLGGLGGLAGDLSKFSPGIYQGSAALSGTGILVASPALRIAPTVALSAGGSLSAALTETFPVASVWSGLGSLAADLARLSLVPQAGASLAATGALAAVALRSLVAGQGALVGSAILSARVSGLMASSALATGDGGLLSSLSQFERVAAAMAASGYSSAGLGQVQHLDRLALAGGGLLSGNVIQTSVRVLTATMTGRPSQGSGALHGQRSWQGLVGQPSIAQRGIIRGRRSGQGLVGQPTTQRGVKGQGDFVTLH
jgi:hypothetical protein